MLKLTEHHHIAFDNIAQIQYEPEPPGVALPLGREQPTIIPQQSSLTIELKSGGEPLVYTGEDADRIWKDYETDGMASALDELEKSRSDV